MGRQNIANMSPEELQHEASKTKANAIIELAYLNGILAMYGKNQHDEIGKIIQDIKKLDDKVPVEEE